MSRHRARLAARRWESRVFGRAPAAGKSFSRGQSSRLVFEQLENRRMLKVDLSLSGTQTIVGGINVNASNDSTTIQQNIAVDINPTNPLSVVGLSQRGTAYTTLGLYRSGNGGLTWTTTTIDNSLDSQGTASTRFDPTVAYDANGKLFIAYGADNGTSTSLIVARSDDNGATFSQVNVVDTQLDAFGGLHHFSLATGIDGLGHQAVYVAYTQTQILSERIAISGSNNNGVTFTVPIFVNDVSHAVTNADVAVGTHGDVNVSWFDQTDKAVRFDRDADGLFIATNTFGPDVTVVDNSTARPTSGNFNLFFNQLTPAAPDHGASSAPVLDVDHSGRASDGSLYIAFADLFNAGTSDIDLYVARSTNGGTSWTIVPLVTDTATNFMPALDVDQASGSVNVMYYSTLGDETSGNDNVNVMVKTSIDAGVTYSAATTLTTASSRITSAASGGNDYFDYNGLAVLDGTIQGMWADYRGSISNVEAFTASASFSSSLAPPLGNILTETGDESAVTNDAVIINRGAANSSFVEVRLNGVLQYAGLLKSLTQVNVSTLAGNDNLTINNAFGIVNLPINYDGGTSAMDDDTLTITGNPGAPVARETYIDSNTAGSGTWVLDPDGSEGPGASLPGNGDELTINFSNLEPVDTDTPATAFDVILNNAANTATIQNGGLLNGANSVSVIALFASFESFRFANKTNVRIMGQLGGDTFTVNYNTAAAGLASLQLFGHVAPDVLGQPADDNSVDTFNIFTDAAGVPISAFGQGGNDSFTVGNGDLSLIPSAVAVIGGDGEDSLIVDDSVRTIAVDYHVDPTTIAICVSPGPPPVDANVATFDATLEHARLNGTQGINRFDVTPSANTDFFIEGNLPNTVPGDFLSIRFAGTTGAHLIETAGAGSWTFTNRKNVNFADIERFNFMPVLVYGADAAKNGKPTVKVVDANSGALITSFLAYESNYTQGVRVAVADINGDGIPEIITAPGHNHSPQIKIFNILTGTELTGTSFNAFDAPYAGGVNVAVGDVNGDGLNDIIVSPSRGKSIIRAFLNQSATVPAVPFDNNHRNQFLALPAAFIGGSMVAVGDVVGDTKAEIIVGAGAGMRDTVRVFDGTLNGSITTVAPFLLQFLPFANNQRGGVSVAVAQLDTDAKLEIVVGSGVGGASQMATYDLNNTVLNPPTLLNTFLALYSGSGSNAPIRLATADTNGDGLSDILIAQGPDGISQELRHAGPTGPVVDFLMETDTEFRNGFYVGADINAILPFIC